MYFSLYWIIWYLHEILSKLLCVQVSRRITLQENKLLLSTKSHVTIYFTLHNFKILYVWEAQIRLQKCLGVEIKSNLHSSFQLEILNSILGLQCLGGARIPCGTFMTSSWPKVLSYLMRWLRNVKSSSCHFLDPKSMGFQVYIHSLTCHVCSFVWYHSLLDISLWAWSLYTCSNYWELEG